MTKIPPKHFVTLLKNDQIEKLRSGLLERGFTFSQPIHTLFSARSEGVICTLYASGKLVVQGKELASFMEFFLEPEVIESFEFTHQDSLADLTPRIGVDESGKGDFFGPLCIASVFADKELIPHLLEIGVKDSKTLSDRTIHKLAGEIRKACQHHVVCIRPKRYNELYLQFGNLNTLLAWGHATAIENLVQQAGCREVSIDQFASEYVVKRALAQKNIEVSLKQSHRGEADPVVAAASILARDRFVTELASLGEQYQIDLPKGAAPISVKVGREFLRLHGIEALEHVSKIHFKTYRAVIE